MSRIKCPNCGASDTIKYGKRHNASGIKQIYRCNKCHTFFVEPDGFERLRYKPEDVTRAVHMYNDGMSLFNVKNHLWQHDGVKVTMWTISRWHKKYAVFLKSASRRSNAKT